MQDFDESTTTGTNGGQHNIKQRLKQQEVYYVSDETSDNDDDDENWMPGQTYSRRSRGDASSFSPTSRRTDFRDFYCPYKNCDYSGKHINNLGPLYKHIRKWHDASFLLLPIGRKMRYKFMNANYTQDIRFNETSRNVLDKGEKITLHILNDEDEWEEGKLLGNKKPPVIVATTSGKTIHLDSEQSSRNAIEFDDSIVI
ncbi:hypothetical protein BDA99DRAFT_610554 [Phascolomyces articulosus]|uniref:Uncharacterized protein n=1 Tax=Phascolomyces articulosus TaxID=60185 RepID=A0AAD5JK24_9FUNG|nr:hypothetical protein BDA99DRAFT_610554 [Phascolomyces articulosus]